MAIEFHCPHCDKFLSTPAEKAGRQAKCPGCGEVITVPEAKKTGWGDEGDIGSPPVVQVSGRRQTCPMCGTVSAAGATVCESCGEELRSTGPGRRRQNTKIEVGNVISTAWSIYKNDMAMTIGLAIVFGVITVLVMLPSIVLNVMADMQIQQGQEAGGMKVLSTLLNWGAQIVNWYFALGFNIAILKIARGEDAQISDIFSGGRFYLRMLGASLLFTIAYVVGLVLCVVPGIYILLMLWPYTLVLVDEDPPGIDCLKRAADFTKGNRLSSLVLMFAVFGIMVLGALACGVGLIIAAPFASLIMAVAYLQMSGQETAHDKVGAIA